MASHDLRGFKSWGRASPSLCEVIEFRQSKVVLQELLSLCRLRNRFMSGPMPSGIRSKSMNAPGLVRNASVARLKLRLFQELCLKLTLIATIASCGTIVDPDNTALAALVLFSRPTERSDSAQEERSAGIIEQGTHVWN